MTSNDGSDGGPSSPPSAKHRLRRLSASIVHYLNLERALSHGPPVDSSDLPSVIIDDFLYLGTGENAANPWILNALMITYVVNAAGLPHGAWEGSYIGRVGEGLATETDGPTEGETDAELGLRIARMIVQREEEKLDALENGHGPEVSPAKSRRRSSLVMPEGTFNSHLDPDLSNLKIAYLNIAVRDSVAAHISTHFKDVTNFIDSARTKFGARARVLLHCQAGVSRSVTLAIAYLMISRGMTLDDAWEWVKGRRNQAHPNVGFARQLLRFYLEELGGTDEGCEKIREFIDQNAPTLLGWK